MTQAVIKITIKNMEAEKTATDLLGDDPKFKDYFQSNEQESDQGAQKTENPLAEYGVPPPGSDIRVSKNALFFKIGTYIMLAILGILVLAAVFKLLTLAPA